MLVNLTPHAIMVRQDGRDQTFNPSGKVARVEVSLRPQDPIEGIPVSQQFFGTVEDMPDPVEGTTYIVSAMVLGRLSCRVDVVAPDTGKTAFRNEKGQITAVGGFVR